jgi:hypothetical protein
VHINVEERKGGRIDVMYIIWIGREREIYKVYMTFISKFPLVMSSGVARVLSREE